MDGGMIKSLECRGGVLDGEFVVSANDSFEVHIMAPINIHATNILPALKITTTKYCSGLDKNNNLVWMHQNIKNATIKNN